MIAGLIASICVAALLIMLLRSLRVLWEDQKRPEGKPGYRRGVWLAMIGLLVVFGAMLGNYGWRAVAVHAPSDHPPLEVLASCQAGIWTFSARGRSQEAQRDLRLRGGRDVHLTLQAKEQATEFFVPGLGLKQRLKAGEQAELRFRPPSPTRSDEAALYRSVCLHHCSGAYAVRPFLLVVEAPRGILAY